MPIVYERAFGGTDTRDPDPRNHLVCRTNPVGLGFNGVRSQLPSITTDYPNLESVLQNSSIPTGFGVISRAWSPRLEWAGTFDQEWQDAQWPLMPRNFDSKHFQAAPVDQQTRCVQMGDTIRLMNFTPDGIWTFELPQLHLPVWLVFDSRAIQSQPKLDTLVIEPDSRRVLMSFRLAIPARHGYPRELIIGSVTRGILRAKQKRKCYINHKNKPLQTVETLLYEP